MNSLFRNAALALGLLLSLGAAASASPISLTNPRPVNPLGAPVGGDSVQTILDGFFGAGVLDDIDDQNAAGYFKLALSGSSVSAPQLKIKNEGTASFGLFSFDGPADTMTPLSEVTLFPTTSAAGWSASVNWLDQDSGFIILTDPTDPFNPTVSLFSGISRNGFGFWGENSVRYYSVDGLNNGSEPKVLTYNDGSTNWGLLFETGSSTPGDFNEGGILIESISPVPEPGSIALCGLALVGFAVYRRRRKA